MKNSLLMLAVTTLTLLLALGLIRHFAPGLLGGPTDMQLVQLDEKMPAFYKGVFRSEHYQAKEFQLKDPLTRVRNHPFLPRMPGLGPHDALGFRNGTVPVVSDVVVIGDSITYGNNAIMEQTWPAFAISALSDGAATVYSMATGGWAAVQYLDMFGKATMFRPHVIVVAFYTGNDPLESFAMVYGNAHWQWLKPDDALEGTDAPRVTFPAPEAERWPVAFGDGVRTVFTPTYRLSSNRDHPAVDAGYAIMADVADRIGELAQQAGIRVAFTVIPTKELAFARKVDHEGLAQPADYATLIRRERARIDSLSESIRAIPGALYIDVLEALQQAVLGPENLYTDSMDGHPAAAGYKVIGETVAAQLGGLLPAAPSGLYALRDGDRFNILLVNDEGAWYFDSQDLIEKNGWPPGELPSIHARDLVNIPHRGTVTTVDATRFGPACCAVR